MPAFAYRDFVRTLSTRFDAALSTIAVEHNFELGAEFEIAICHVLRDLLPDRFGVTRGYVVNFAGDAAGDDIVIYERTRFPTLAGRAHNDFSRKEFVPIESAYAYIEAKHSLHLAGNGGQSLSHAVAQVARVKSLVSTRVSVPFGRISPYLELRAPITVAGPQHFPSTVNPFFAIVLARHVRNDAAGPILSDPAEVVRGLQSLAIPSDPGPDHLVLGRSNILIPAVPNPDGSSSQLGSPFFIPSKSAYASQVVPDLAFGVSLISLLEAIDWIQLGVMPWPQVLANALGIPSGAHGAAV